MITKPIVNTLTVLLIFITACEEKDKPLSPDGMIKLSSEFLGSTIYYVNGFSFEEEEFVPTVNSGGKVADIIPENILMVNGDVSGVLFSSGGGNNTGFYKNFEGESLEEAEAFFDNYTEVSAPQYSELTDTLSVGQVYTLKNYKENFVKILIRELQKRSGTYSDFYEVSIEYYIQRDGSEIFEE